MRKKLIISMCVFSGLVVATQAVARQGQSLVSIPELKSKNLGSKDLLTTYEPYRESLTSPMVTGIYQSADDNSLLLAYHLSAYNYEAREQFTRAVKQSIRHFDERRFLLDSYQVGYYTSMKYKIENKIGQAEKFDEQEWIRYRNDVSNEVGAIEELFTSSENSF